MMLSATGTRAGARRCSAILGLGTILLVAGAAHAWSADAEPPGAVDPSFVSTTVEGGLNGPVGSLVVQSDGKILAGGSFDAFHALPAPGLIRLNADGTRDTSFAQTGTGLNGDVESVAIQTDGKVVAGGAFTSYDGAAARRLIRLNADGSRDDTFAPLGSGLRGPEVLSVAIQPDGKILASGDFTAYDGEAASYLLRLNADGTRDSTFPEPGPGPGLNGPVRTMLVQPDGKVLVAGDFSTFNVKPASYLVRFNADGTRDNTFVQAGAGFDASLQSLALQPDGKILVAGYFSSYGGEPARDLIRLNADGTRDDTFALRNLRLPEARCLIVQPDGRILVFVPPSPNGGPVLFRLNADGSLDSTFAPGGSLACGLCALAVQPDHKILAAALFTSTDGETAWGLVRLTPDISRDPTFTQVGTGLDKSVYALLAQPDGRILAGGDFTSGNGEDRPHLLRLNTDGTYDPSLTQTGVGLDGRVSTLALQPDDRILAGGDFTSYDGAASRGIVRLNPDGTLDSAFAPSGTGLDGSVSAITVQPDGRVLAAGSFSSYNGQAARSLIRLNPDGTRDETFAVDGSHLFGFAALALQPDGRVLAGGSRTMYNGETTPALIRFNADGTRDKSFNLTGTGIQGAVYSLVMQPDGKILVGGDFRLYNWGDASYLIRLNADGSRDGTFTQTGAGVNGTVYSLALQPDGKVLAAGMFRTYNGKPAQHLIRFNPDGTVDPTFTQTGAGLNNPVRSVAVQADGNVLVGGDFSGYDEQPFAFVTRLLGDAPRFFASTSAVGFGAHPTGSSSPDNTLTVSNIGNAPLIFADGAVTLVGDKPGQFTLAHDTCTGRTVSMADTCTVTVRFTPTSPGEKAATLRFASNALASPHAVRLTGQGTAPTFNAAPHALDYGDQPTGTTTSSIATITNTGTAPLVFTAGAITLTEGSRDQFALGKDTCSGATIAPAGTCTVTVRFTPSSTGTKVADLTLASNAPGSPHTVPLTGTGIAPVTPRLPQPQTLRPLARAVKAGTRASLPQWTQQGALLTWRTTTRNVCKVKSVKVAAKRKGVCQLRSTAPAVPGYLAYTGRVRIRVT